MIFGIGIDLIEVVRFRGYKPGSPEAIFSPGELDYCLSMRYPERHFAARFAAREAFFKAVGSGALTPGEMALVEVILNPAGSPSLKLTGAVAERAERLGVRLCHLSLTHTDTTAGAAVLLET